MSASSPLGPLAIVGRLVEPVYRAEVGRRNRRWDRGEGVTSFPIPVISVGNLSVGGTGKTPMCRWIVQTLMELGRRPALVMRGYKAEAGQRSDEEAEYVDAFPSLLVRANPNRTEAIAALLASADAPDCIVLDDGFQHRAVARDLDVVLIDATRPHLDGRCLPAGWLREPMSSLSRAGAVVLTRTDLVGASDLDRIEQRLRNAAGDAPIVRTVHRWTTIVSSAGESRGVDVIAGTRVVAAAAIGNPDAFIDQLRTAGADVADTMIRRDHHAWAAGDLDAMASMVKRTDAAAVVTTEKDWVKLRALATDGLGVPVLRPRVAIDAGDGAAVLRSMVEGVLSR